MDDIDHNEISSTTPVSITVLSVIPMRAGKLFALASVEIDIDGVPIEIHGIGAARCMCRRPRPGFELATFRDAAGRSGAAIILPEEVRGPIGDAVLDQFVEIGLAVKRPALTAPQLPDARAVSFGG